MANIMIVDDSPMIRRSLREMVEAFGHRVAAEAETGKEAIQAYMQHEIDLVTMDIQLPGMNGIEAVRQIRACNPQANIVVISSVEERGKVYEAIKQGAKHYIIKPFTADKVNEVIHTVLGVPPRSRPDVRVESAVQARQAETADRPAQKPDPLKLHNPVLSALPFELVMKDGRIVLIVQRHISETNIRLFLSCLQGLLYYRKAKYVLELWEPIHHDQGSRTLLEFVAAIRERNGTIGVVTGDPAYYTQLKAKLRNGVYRSYAEIEW